MLEVLKKDLHTESSSEEKIGLSSEEADRLLSVTGENRLSAKKKNSSPENICGTVPRYYGYNTACSNCNIRTVRRIYRRYSYYDNRSG